MQNDLSLLKSNIWLNMASLLSGSRGLWGAKILMLWKEAWVCRFTQLGYRSGSWCFVYNPGTSPKTVWSFDHEKLDYDSLLWVSAQCEGRLKGAHWKTFQKKMCQILNRASGWGRGHPHVGHTTYDTMWLQYATVYRCFVTWQGVRWSHVLYEANTVQAQHVVCQWMKLKAHFWCLKKRIILPN